MAEDRMGHRAGEEEKTKMIWTIFEYTAVIVAIYITYKALGHLSND
jgi:hypothetical protein